MTSNPTTVSKNENTKKAGERPSTVVCGSDSRMSIETQKEDSSEEEDQFSKQPPIQNGFVVFVHQLNICCTDKTKRTVVQWISDALRILDIVPEVTTVDKMIQQSLAHLPVTDNPIIKYSKLPPTPTPGVGKDVKRPVVVSKSVKNATIKVLDVKRSITAAASKVHFPTLSRKSSVTVAQSVASKTSRSGVGYKSKETSKSCQKNVKTKTIVGTKEEKTKDRGVDPKVFKHRVRLMQRDNRSTIWVLLVETKRRCMVDMERLNQLASRFRFKVKWIAAQAPGKLDQNVFSVVNEIVQTKNICFPEQLRLNSIQVEPPVEAIPPVIRKKNKTNKSKTASVEVLHKTQSVQFDIMSYASLEIDELIKKVVPIESELLTVKSEPDAFQEERQWQYPVRQQTSEEEVLKELPEDLDNSNCVEKDAAELNVGNGIQRKKVEPPTLLNESTRLVQLALITTKNPFASPWMRTDLPGFNGLIETSDELAKGKQNLVMTADVGDAEVPECWGTNESRLKRRSMEPNFSNIVHALRKRFKRRPFGARRSLRQACRKIIYNEDFFQRSVSLSSARLIKEEADMARSSQCTLPKSPVLLKTKIFEDEKSAAMSASFIPLTHPPHADTSVRNTSSAKFCGSHNKIDAKSDKDSTDDDTYDTIDLTDYTSDSGDGDQSSSDSTRIKSEQTGTHISLPSPAIILPELASAKRGIAFYSSSDESDLGDSGTKFWMGPGDAKACKNMVGSGIEMEDEVATLDSTVHYNTDRVIHIQSKIDTQCENRTHKGSKYKADQKTSSFFGCLSRICSCTTMVRDT